MDDYLKITKALSDPARVRVILSLKHGELCLCQLIELLELAPSTVSKHLSLLHDAGLVKRRKEGRWHYFRLAGRGASPMVRRMLRITFEALQDDDVARQDADAVCCIRGRELDEVACCYSA